MKSQKMQKLESSAREAEELVDLASKRPRLLLPEAQAVDATKPKWKSIYQRLTELFLEESVKATQCKEVTCASHLLEKLVHRDGLNSLVVNLYPASEGYSLMLKGRNGYDSETIKLPYEESELLQYIDGEQLPPLLVELLDKAQANVFYCGCVIAELRDYRRTANGSFSTCYVLLKPSSHTLACDVTSMTRSENHYWLEEDKMALESQLLLQTSAPLCLDPSPVVSHITGRLQRQQAGVHTQALRRSVRKYSQAAINRKRKMAQSIAPKSLRLFDFLARKKDKFLPNQTVNLKVGKACVDMWRQREVHLAAPSAIDVEKYAKVVEKPKLTYDNTPIVVEEYTFETERSMGKVNFSKLTIMQRLNDEHYLGQLYVDRDYVEGRSQGSTCKFTLGTKANVDKYIRQFREIFTEEGRRQVKITHQVPGQPPMVGVAGGSTDSSLKKTHPPIRLSVSINAQGVPGGAQPAKNATQPTAQLTLNLQHQQPMTASQRVRQLGLLSSTQRTPATPSPASTPTTPGQPPLATVQATLTSPGQTLVSVASRPASLSLGATVAGGVPTAASGGVQTVSGVIAARRLSRLDSAGSRLASAQGGSKSVSAPPTPSYPPGDTIELADVTSGTSALILSRRGSQAGAGGAEMKVKASTPPPNVNIASLAGLSPGISVQNLQNLNLSGLQNVQVSLGGVNLSGSIAVPLSLLSQAGGSQSLGAHTGILVGSLGGGSGTSTSTTSSPQITVTSSGQPHSTIMAVVTSSAGLNTTAGGSTSQAGLLTTATVTMGTSSILSLPIGNITQIMAGIKGTQGLRPGTPLLLSQIPGQPNQSLQVITSSGLPRVRLAASPASKSGVMTTSTITAARLASAGGDGAQASLAQLPMGQGMTQQLVQLARGGQEAGVVGQTLGLQARALHPSQHPVQKAVQLQARAKAKKKGFPSPKS